MPCAFYCLSCFYQGIQRVCGLWKPRSLNRKIENQKSPLSKSAITLQHIYWPFLCPVHGSLQLVLLCATKGGSKRSRFHVSCVTLVGFSGCHSRIASLAFFQMLYRQNSTVVTTKTTSLMRLDLQFDHLNAHLFRLANRVNHDLTFLLVYIPFSIILQVCLYFKTGKSPTHHLSLL